MRPVILAALLLAGLSACSPSRDKVSAEAAVLRFHAFYDVGDSRTIYDSAGDEFKKVMPRDDFISMLRTIHRRLGDVRKADQKGWRMSYDSRGYLVTLDYRTDFVTAPGDEQFVYRIRDGKPELAGYRVTSQALQGY
jgi:hypothetical protein